VQAADIAQGTPLRQAAIAAEQPPD